MTPAGAPGTVAGVTALDWVNVLVPTALTAATRKMYSVPLLRPVTGPPDVAAVGGWGVHVLPPLPEYWSTYPVIPDPPLSSGAVHDTSACALPLAAVTPIGAPGTVAGAGAIRLNTVLLRSERPREESVVVDLMEMLLKPPAFAT